MLLELFPYNSGVFFLLQELSQQLGIDINQLDLPSNSRRQDLICLTFKQMQVCYGRCYRRFQYRYGSNVQRFGKVTLYNETPACFGLTSGHRLYAQFSRVYMSQGRTKKWKEKKKVTKKLHSIVSYQKYQFFFVILFHSLLLPTLCAVWCKSQETNRIYGNRLELQL